MTQRTQGASRRNASPRSVPICKLRGDGKNSFIANAHINQVIVPPVALVSSIPPIL